MNSFYKNLALWLVIGLTMVALFNFFNRRQPEWETVEYSEFIFQVRNNNVAEVNIRGHDVEGKYQRGGKRFKTYSPDDPEMIGLLLQKGVRVNAEPPEKSSWYMNALLSWLPMILLLGIWIFFMRQMQSGGSKALSFGKSRARMLSDQKKKATFLDVAGVDEAKEELMEIVELLKDPQKFQKLGGKIPKGVLLVGAPGTGKTLLARAIAGEAGVPFFSISGSDFVEMFVGVGASRVRDLFEQGKKHAPCIIFIDEIDAVGRHRGAGLGGGHDEREQTLNQLLVEMDGFESNDGVILMSATNRPDVLDPALLRPGRFDRQVIVPTPDMRGRTGILKVHSRGIPLANDVDLEIVARGTPGFCGADLANLVNEAALLAARLSKKAVEMEDLESAKDKVLMGAERHSMIISEEEKRNIAFHEAGHSLVAVLLPGTDPIHKVTIIPRGMALGITQQLPIDEKHTYPKEYLLNNVAILMGGRAAEELVLKSMTTGAGNDIERATELTRKMVCEWGMSELMGPLSFGKRDEQIFLGKEIARHKDYSEKTAVEIDREVKRLVKENYERAHNILKSHLDTLYGLANALLERESLDGKEIEEIVRAATKVEGGKVGSPVPARSAAETEGPARS